MRVPPVQTEVDGEPVSPALPDLLAGVYAQVQRDPLDLPALRSALGALLRYLASPAGRTNANCWAADSFFMHNDRWARDWDHLPEPYQDIFGALGGALHDTVSHPEVAQNFDSTPEQLLTRLEQIESSTQAV